jgi:hypothetical protein
MSRWLERRNVVQYGVIMWLSVTAIVIVGVLVAARLGLGIGIRLARSIELIPLATISTSIVSAWAVICVRLGRVGEYVSRGERRLRRRGLTTTADSIHLSPPPI